MQPQKISLTLADAQKLSLHSQGFGTGYGTNQATDYTNLLNTLQVLQLDSVNVFARSHYLPLFARAGEYSIEDFDQFLWQSNSYTEYWAHEAALIPVADRPLFAWRMQEFARRNATRMQELGPSIARVRAQLADSGPQFIGELEAASPRYSTGSWWDRSDTKQAVELLFSTGEVAIASRKSFRREYALAAQILPDHVFAEIPQEEAQQQLVEQAVLALGVGVVSDIADYYRLKITPTRVALLTLQLSGKVVPVHVEGWKNSRGEYLPAWVHKNLLTVINRGVEAPSSQAALPNALLTPFDPLVWYRPRTERLFQFHYRIEIYTPAKKRIFGYYCLPLLVDGKLVGRIDLKADRAERTLLVQAAWSEEHAPDHTASVATELLSNAARWQGLERITWSGIGNLILPKAFVAATF